MRILLQFPEGLKKLAFEEAAKLEREGHEVFVSSSPCFGACDLALDEARAIGAKKIIHWGHSDFGVKSKIPVEYREYPMEVNTEVILPRVLEKLGVFTSIGLLTTIQHTGQLAEIKGELERSGKTVFVGQGSKTKHPGQVLGCDAGAAKSIEGRVNCFLYFGGGLFHPLMDVDRPVLRADPFSGKVEWLDEEISRAKKRRKAGMSALVQAKRIGILVSTKPGQVNAKQALLAKKALEERGKACTLLVANFIDFSSIRNFGSFDCYVNTACPRLSDDSELAGKPIINFQDAIEVAKMLGERK